MNILWTSCLVIYARDCFPNPGNTRVISQNALQTFQDEMAKVKKDPYKVVMRQTKLPISLLNETAKVSMSADYEIQFYLTVSH